MNTHMDFRPNRKRRGSSRSSAGLRGILPYLLAPLLVLGAFMYYRHLEGEITRLETETEAFRQQGREYDEITAAYNRLLDRQSRITTTLAAVRHLTEETAPFRGALDVLIPRLVQAEDGVAQGYLRSVELAPRNAPTIRDNADAQLPGLRLGVTLAGTARSPDTVAEIVSEFEDDPTTEAIFDRAVAAGVRRYDYDLTLAMILDPDAVSDATGAPPASEEGDTPEQDATEVEEAAEADPSTAEDASSDTPSPEPLQPAPAEGETP